MRKLILILLIIGMIMPMVMAIDDRYTFNEKADMKFSCETASGTICDSSYKCNLTLLYPNKTMFLSDSKATYNLNYFNVSTNNLTEKGIWTGMPSCCTGSTCKQTSYLFEVTDNGKENPTAGVIVLFCILYLIIIAFMLYAITASIIHLVNFDMTLMDLMVTWSSYFVLFATFVISKQYLNNLVIQNFFELLVKITGYTNIVIPAMFFLICMIKRNLEFKKENPYG